MVQSGWARRQLLRTHTSHKCSPPQKQTSLTKHQTRKHTGVYLPNLLPCLIGPSARQSTACNQMNEFKQSPTVRDTVKVQLATALLHAATAEWGFGTLR